MKEYIQVQYLHQWMTRLSSDQIWAQHEELDHVPAIFSNTKIESLYRCIAFSCHQLHLWIKI